LFNAHAAAAGDKTAAAAAVAGDSGSVVVEVVEARCGLVTVEIKFSEALTELAVSNENQAASLNRVGTLTAMCSVV
jgi:hypothetical protein